MVLGVTLPKRALLNAWSVLLTFFIFSSIIPHLSFQWGLKAACILLSSILFSKQPYELGYVETTTDQSSPRTSVENFLSPASSLS